MEISHYTYCHRFCGWHLWSMCKKYHWTARDLFLNGKKKLTVRVNEASNIVDCACMRKCFEMPYHTAQMKPLPWTLRTLRPWSPEAQAWRGRTRIRARGTWRCYLPASPRTSVSQEHFRSVSQASLPLADLQWSMISVQRPMPAIECSLKPKCDPMNILTLVRDKKILFPNT